MEYSGCHVDQPCSGSSHHVIGHEARSRLSVYPCMVSEEVLEEIDKAGLEYIVGVRMRKAPRGTSCKAHKTVPGDTSPEQHRSCSGHPGWIPRLRGADGESDIDVAVISPDFGRDRLKEAVRLKLLTEHVDTNISPHPYSPKEVDESVRGTFLHDEILAKGK